MSRSSFAGDRRRWVGFASGLGLWLLLIGAPPVDAQVVDFLAFPGAYPVPASVSQSLSGSQAQLRSRPYWTAYTPSPSVTRPPAPVPVSRTPASAYGATVGVGVTPYAWSYSSSPRPVGAGYDGGLFSSWNLRGSGYDPGLSRGR